MSHYDNSDRTLRYKHMVLRRDAWGVDILTYTDKGEPAVYGDAAAAELRAADLRTRHPGSTYRVISFQVL